MAGPERASGWLGAIMPVLEKGSAVSTLLLLLVGGLTIYGMFREMKRVHRNNETLVERLLTTKDEQLAYVRTLVRCVPAEAPQAADGR